MEKLEEELRALNGTGILQEVLEIQLTWTLGSTQRLNHQQKSLHCLD